MLQPLKRILVRMGILANEPNGSNSTNPINYQDVYENLYQQGYHSDLSFSNAKDLVAWIKSNLQFSSILDIGCSNGWALQQFADGEIELAGLDPSQTAIDYCKAKGIEATVGCAHELPFKDNQFELVISTDCLEHVCPEHVSDSIKEIHRVAEKYIALKICPNVDEGDWKKLAGHDLHLTVKPLRWWKREFTKHGGKVIYTDRNEIFVIELS